MKKNFPCGLKNKYIQKFDELYRRTKLQKWINLKLY